MWYLLKGSFSIVSLSLLFEMLVTVSEKSAGVCLPTNVPPDEPVLGIPLSDLPLHDL